MTGMDEAPSDPAERHLTKPSQVKDAWAQTIEDMEAVAEGRREDGWEVLTIPAVHTDAVGRDGGSDDRFGLKPVVPDNYADEFAEVYGASEFDEVLVYGIDIGSDVFRVGEYLDTDRRTGILIAMHYELEFSTGMVTAATEEGVVYTHARTIDGTHLGTFEHEDYEPLLPTRHQSDGTGDEDGD